MAIDAHIALLDEILGTWQDTLGVDYAAYRNHVYRMAHFTLALHDCDEDARRKVIIAACFHDLGIWSDDTVDYLPPSVVLAQRYLKDRGLQAWSSEITLMIDQHHKLRAYHGAFAPLVEAFRRADLVDLSLGLIRFGLPAAMVSGIRAQFPNAGFHKRLGKLAANWFGQHPLSAPPFLKW